jgi:hypothetical protein
MFWDLAVCDINVVLVVLCCKRSYCGWSAVLNWGMIVMEIDSGRHYMVCGWLSCRVDKGMFSDELAVTYPAEGEQLASVFVEDKYVRIKGENRGEVWVTVTGYGGSLSAVLPSCDRDRVQIEDKDFRIDEEREKEIRAELEKVTRSPDGIWTGCSAAQEIEGQVYPAAEGQQDV